MGCANTSIYIEEDTRKLTDEKTAYIVRNEKLERLAQDILDDCIKKHNGSPQGIKEIANETGLDSPKIISKTGSYSKGIENS